MYELIACIISISDLAENGVHKRFGRQVGYGYTACLNYLLKAKLDTEKFTLICSGRYILFCVKIEKPSTFYYKKIAEFEVDDKYCGLLVRKPANGKTGHNIVDDYEYMFVKICSRDIDFIMSYKSLTAEP